MNADAKGNFVIQPKDPAEGIILYPLSVRSMQLREVVYKRRTAIPAAAMKPGMAVWMAPPPELVEEPPPVAPEAMEEAAELRELATLLAAEEMEAAPLERLLSMDEPDDSAPDAADDALAPAPPPKIVVLPTVVVIAEPSVVMTDSIADVVIAELPESVPEPEPPEPPAPPAP